MTVMNFIDCSTCNKLFLVGINGMDIRKKLRTTSNLDIENNVAPKEYFAIGNDELDKCNVLPDEVKCNECGRNCKVLTAKNMENEVNG